MVSGLAGTSAALNDSGQVQSRRPCGAWLRHDTFRDAEPFFGGVDAGAAGLRGILEKGGNKSFP